MKALFYLLLHNLSKNLNEIASFLLQPGFLHVFYEVYMCLAEPMPSVIGLFLCLL